MVQLKEDAPAGEGVGGFQGGRQSSLLLSHVGFCPPTGVGDRRRPVLPCHGNRPQCAGVGEQAALRAAGQGRTQLSYTHRHTPCSHGPVSRARVLSVQQACAKSPGLALAGGRGLRSQGGNVSREPGLQVGVGTVSSKPGPVVTQVMHFDHKDVTLATFVCVCVCVLEGFLIA